MIPPAGQGEIRVIDLGEAESIEAAALALRHGIELGRSVLREGSEAESEASLNHVLEALAERVLRPLLPHIGTSPRWILSPDKALWLIPWAALPAEQGRYAIEDHAIQLVVSGRALAHEASVTSNGRPLVLTNPDLDLDLAAIRQTPPGVLGGGQAADTESAAWGLARDRTSGPRSPSSRASSLARSVEPALAEFAGTAPMTVTGRWALEAVFKAERRPRLVLLDTPGFLLEDARGSPGKVRDASSRSTAVPEHRLLRCGLLFAGCNRAQAGDGEDGVLTGLEVVGTDLRGTELVVLGAFDSGSAPGTGDALATLRQAFHLAGAQAVVTSLWRTPDDESARLLTRFFEGLTAGQRKDEALRQAQLAVIRSRRERTGAAHPIFWAAPTLSVESQ